MQIVKTFLTAAVAILAPAAAAIAADAPVSFTHDIRPVLNSKCVACHKPDKTKGELDMTTFAMLAKGGKHGSSLVAGDPGKSKLFTQISGDEPEMPPEGDPLKQEQVSLIERWIKEGAKDDTPAPGTTKIDPPIYTIAPPVTAMAWSPDGSVLAISGYHEVLVYSADGSKLLARLLGEAPRIESIAFSKDGSMIGVAGGAPAEFGQVQIWDAKTYKPLHVFQPSTDSLYGLSFSPDGKTVAVGGADKIARRISIADGKILTDFRAHADWVLATTFTLDGKLMVTGGRDKEMKLVDVASGRFVDDINNPLEQILCMARHPSQEQILYGGDLGVARLYKISDNQGRTAGRNDTNLLVEFERLPAAVTAVAFRPDGNQVALGTMGEVRIYDSKGVAPAPAAMKAKKPRGKAKPPKVVVQSKAVHILDGFSGPVFAVAWKPDGSVIAAAGSDGHVRFFDANTGDEVKDFIAAPLKK